jgi:hypothetical protein
MGFLSSFFSGATDGGGYTGAEDGGYGLEGGLGQSSDPGGGIGGGYTGAEDGGYGLEGGLGQSSGPGGGIGGSGYTGAEDGGYGLEGGLGQSSVPGKAAPGGGVGPSLAGKAVEAAKSMFTVRGKDGKPNVPLTVLDIAAKGLWDCQGWHERNRRDLWPHHNDSRRSCRRASELHCVSRGQPKPREF